ncbi:methyltransferase-like protein 22, partial [Tigriopus californicus]|uniref:methyltransferase-like protein 22 n=1 Tax=Tigriopus californicus TaxID=6832 RepID=UPI0027DA278C
SPWIDEDGDLDVPRGNVTTNKKLKPTSPFEHIQRDQEGGQTASTTPSEQKQHHHRDEDQETEAQIWLEYKTQTRLNEVGAQVWRGSLFLADFLFNYPKALQGKRVLEIGAGTGLASVVALLCQPQGLVATDLAFNLDLLERNLARNVSCLSGMLSNQAQDERQDRIYRVMPCDIKTIISDKESATGVQTQTGPTLVEQVLTARQVTSSMDVYLGADLVYDQDLSEALVGLIRHIAYSLLREPSSKAQTRVVLLSIDKRYVFTLKDAEIKAPMFEHFYQELREMLGHLPPRIKAVLREHDMMDVTQFFRYQASSDLIILEVIFSS